MDNPVYPRALLDALRREPGTVAFEHGERRVSRGELLELITGYAAELRRAGVGPGRGVAIHTAITPEGFAALIAANALGSRVVGIRPGLSDSHLGHILDDVGFLVTDVASATPRLRRAAERCRVLTVEDDLRPDRGPLEVLGRRESIAFVAFTSGSTGVPKGTAFTYAALTGNRFWQPTVWGPRTRELARCYGRFLLYGPLTCGTTFDHLGLCLLSGGTAVIPTGPPDFPHVFERLGISAVALTVPGLHHCLDVLRDKDIDVSSLRSVIAFGSPLAPHRLTEGFERFGAALRHVYGQTEGGTLTMLTRADVEQQPLSQTSVGRVCEHVRLEVRDERGRRLSPGRTGELWFRTPGQLCGYWDDDDEATEVLHDGWVRTRDLGHLGDNGFVYLTGRSRDVVIVDATMHYAGPIEMALAAHPDVDQAYVVGTPDEETGEAIHAIVVPERGRDPDPDELCRAVRRRLGAAAVPAHLHRAAEVPLMPDGKPDKRALLAHVLGSRA